MRKSGRIAVSVLLAISMFTMAACSKGKTEEKVIKEQTDDTGSNTGSESSKTVGERTPVTFTMYTDATTPKYQIEETPIGKMIMDNTNVTLKIDYLVDDEDTKEGILLTSGDYPDLMTSRHCSKFIEAGAVIPLDDYIEKYGQDLKKLYGDELEAMRAPDGHIYNITNSRMLKPWSKQPGKAMYIQQAVLKEFNYPEIKTLDQYFDIIKQYQEKYPEINGQKTIGFTMLTDDWRFGIGVLGPVKFLNGFQDDGEVLIDDVNGTYKSRLLYNSEEAKKYFSKVNDMYLSGNFDEACFTTNYDSYQEKLVSGRVLGFHDQYWEIEESNATILASDHPERAYVGLPIVMENGITELYNQPTPPEVSKGIMISTSCKDPERAFQFINDLCKEENQKLTFWGVEGVEYTKNADGKFTFNEEQLELWKDDDYLQKRGVKAFDYPFPVVSNMQFYEDGNCGRPNGVDEFMRSFYTDLDNELCDAYGWATLQSGFTYTETRDYGFAWSMNPQTNGDDDAAYAQMTAQDLMKSYVPKLIFASDKDDFNTIWDDYDKKMSEIDVKAYTDFIDAKIIERIKTGNKSLQ